MFGHKGRIFNDLEVSKPSSASLSDRRREAHKNLEQTASKMKQNFDRKHKHAQKYKKGDLVLWKGGPSCNQKGVSNKLSEKYTGPYVIIKVFGYDRYKKPLAHQPLN